MRQGKLQFLFILIAALIPSAPMQAVHAEEDKAMTLKLTSTAFAHEGAIPKVHTCEGQDASPPLAWSGVFGAPTFFVGDQMFWGQDRMDFVREALQ